MPKPKTMTKTQAAIYAWNGSTETRSKKNRGYCESERATMVKVMKETKGEGGPWFRDRVFMG